MSRGLGDMASAIFWAFCVTQKKGSTTSLPLLVPVTAFLPTAPSSHPQTRTNYIHNWTTYRARGPGGHDARHARLGGNCGDCVPWLCDVRGRSLADATDARRILHNLSVSGGGAFLTDFGAGFLVEKPTTCHPSVGFVRVLPREARGRARLGHFQGRKAYPQERHRSSSTFLVGDGRTTKQSSLLNVVRVFMRRMPR